MTVSEIILTAAVSISPVVSLVVAIIVARRSKDKSVKVDGEERGKLSSDLSYIKSSVERVEKKLDTIDERQDVQDKQLAVLQEKVEQVECRRAHV